MRVLLALIALAAASVSVTAPASAERYVTVDFAALDLTTSAGAAEAHDALKRAAETVCRRDRWTGRHNRRARVRCTAATLDHFVAQIDARLLTAYAKQDAETRTAEMRQPRRARS